MFRAVYLLALLASGIAADSKSVDCAFSDKDGTCFGHDLKSKYFNLDPAFCNMNHGSFGVVAKPVSTAQQQFFLEQESHPDTWFRKSYFDYVEQARSAIATLVNANADDIVMVENASSAVNSILRSFGFQKGDKVLRLSSAYGMVSNTLNWLATTVGIEVIVVDVEYPVKDSTQIIKSVAEALRANPDIKLSIFSHISSTPAMIEPIEVLIPLAHAANSLVLVDGAHAPGVLDLNLTALNSDFYLGNCHKWLYAPKGTAFLYVKSSQQLENFPQPTVISSSGEPEYIGRYRYTGTRDYTGFSSIPVAVDFLSTLGGMKQIQTYNHELAVQGARYLVDAWKTYMLIPEPLSGYMVNIVLPSNDEDAVVDMQATLDSQYNIYIVVSSVPTTNADGTTSTIYFTRLSAQVYLEMSDFEQLGTLVPQLLAEYAAKKNKGTTTN